MCFFYFLNALYVSFLSFLREHLPQLLQHITSCGVRILKTKMFWNSTERTARKFTVRFAFRAHAYRKYNIKKIMEISKNTDVLFLPSARRLLELSSSAIVRSYNYREPP